MKKKSISMAKKKGEKVGLGFMEPSLKRLWLASQKDVESIDKKEFSQEANFYENILTRVKDSV